jgi:UDP-N-acetylmuramate dehydrogenase
MVGNVMINDLHFDKLCQLNVSLSIHSSYGIGGNASFFTVPETIEELLYILNHCKKCGLEFFVFGHGSNIRGMEEQ